MSNISYDPRAFAHKVAAARTAEQRAQLVTHHAALRRADLMLGLAFLISVVLGATLGVILP